MTALKLPPVAVTLPPATPAPYGLADVATIVDQQIDRHLGGVEAYTPNGGVGGLWALGDTDDPQGKTGPRQDPTHVDPVVVWAADECHTVGVTQEDALARAQHTLRLREPSVVEVHTAKRLLSEVAADPDGPVGLVDAVAVMDTRLAGGGYSGVVHAHRGLIAYLEEASQIIRHGSALFTPGGHRWAFGVGYAPLGSTLVGTGPVQIIRGPVEAHAVVDARRNMIHAVAERCSVVVYDRPLVAVMTSQGVPAGGE